MMASPLLALFGLLLTAAQTLAFQAPVLNPTPLGSNEHHPADTRHPKHKLWSPRHLLYKIDKAAKVTVSSYVYTTSPSNFTVSWANVSSPGAGDLIGIWSPGEDDPSTVAPIFWLSANVPGYNTTGSGSVSFYNIYNLRNNYRFRLVSGQAFPNPTVIAESDLIINKIPNRPQQVHLSIYEDSKSIVVQWVSNTSAPTQVRYSLSRGVATAKKVWTSMSTSTKYTRAQMCGPPATLTAFTDPGYTHTAVIDSKHIGHNIRVYYVVGDAMNGMTKEFSFRSPPKVGGEDTLKFVVFNDVGSISETLFNDTCICTNYTSGAQLPNITNSVSCSNNTDGSHTCCSGYCPIPAGTPPGQQWYLTMFQYTPNSLKLPPVLVKEESDAHLAILNGDLSYAQGYTDSWDIFGHQMEPATSMWPMATGLGNHERDYPNTGDVYNSLLPVDQTPRDSGGECGVSYTYRYYNPGPGDVLDNKMSYHSFEMGPVLFIILDTETASDPKSAQGKWVKKVLDNVSKRTPWVVVSTHRMMLWPSVDTRKAQGDQDTSARLLADLEDVFLGKVHFVTAGHMHAYGRTCSVYKYQCTQPASKSFIKNPKAPIYILAGNAGAGFTHSFPPVLPDWVSFGAQDINGYVRFEADMTTITMQAVATDALNWSQGARNFTFGAGAVFDSVTLTK